MNRELYYALIFNHTEIKFYYIDPIIYDIETPIDSNFRHIIGIVVKENNSSNSFSIIFPYNYDHETIVCIFDKNDKIYSITTPFFLEYTELSKDIDSKVYSSLIQHNCKQKQTEYEYDSSCDHENIVEIENTYDDKNSLLSEHNTSSFSKNEFVECDSNSDSEK